jgi:hypothetical protein
LTVSPSDALRASTWKNAFVTPAGGGQNATLTAKRSRGP